MVNPDATEEEVIAPVPSKSNSVARPEFPLPFVTFFGLLTRPDPALAAGDHGWYILVPLPVAPILVESGPRRAKGSVGMSLDENRHEFPW